VVSEKQTRNFEEAEETFEKFAELAEAIEKENEIMQSEANKYLAARLCPLMNKKCIQMECSWYIICLNKNIRAFKEYFQH
jgi:hypothetical protein